MTVKVSLGSRRRNAVPRGSAPSNLNRAQENYLRGPVILHGGWPCPERLEPLIPPARERVVRSGHADMASDEEALAYISTASLCGPLDHDHASIMLYLTQKVLRESRRPIDDSDAYIGAFQEGLLRGLKRKIYASVVKHASARSRRDTENSRSR